MTDKELKQLIKTAYCLPETDKGNKFIRDNEKRTGRFSEIIKNECRYMGIRSAFAGILLCVFFSIISKSGDESMMWVASSIIPICSVIPMSFIFRSEKYGMSELEASCRFSLKLIRLSRMLILGLFSGVITLFGGIIFKSLWTSGAHDVITYMLFPYFVSVRGGLLIVRKYRNNNTSLGVAAVCIATGFLPTVIQEFRNVNFVSDYMFALLAVALLCGIIIECTKYINERSDISWNLC